MLKKTIIFVSLVSLFVAGCSTDQRYRQEVEGNVNYLKTTELKPLIVPEGVTIPTESADYYIYKAANEGETGMDIDIRPPALPIPTIADAYASFENGAVTLDMPSYSSFWDRLPAILQHKNIPIEYNDNMSVKTGVTLIHRADAEQAVEASYLIQHNVKGSREFVTVELTSLKRMGQNVASTIEHQRYTVDFFNMLMAEIAPENIPSID